MKPLSDPWKTTIKGLQNKANVLVTVRQIQSKLITYGIISSIEEKFLREHTDYGKTDQKEAIS